MAISLAHGGNCYFYKLINMSLESATGAKIADHIKTAIEELFSKGIHTFSVCADNASNMQLALSQVERDFGLEAACEESESSSSSFSFESDALYPLTSQDEESLGHAARLGEDATFSGILRYQCTAHTLQLCIGDIFSLPRLAEVRDVVRSLVGEFCTVTGKKRLHGVQSIRGTTPILFIKKYADTRWNSFYESMLSVHSLRTVLICLREEEFPHSFFSDLTLAIRLAAPFAIATDRTQGDGVGMEVMVGELKKIREELQTVRLSLEGEADKAVVDSVVEVYDKRELKNFGYLGLRLFSFLSPSTYSLEMEDCEELSEKLISHLLAYTKSRKLRSVEAEIRDQVEKVCLMPPATGEVSFSAFWRTKLHSFKVVAPFALELAASLTTEAPTERQFKVLKRLLCAARAGLSDKSAIAQLCVAVNLPLVFPNLFGKKRGEKEKRQKKCLENAVARAAVV